MVYYDKQYFVVISNWGWFLLLTKGGNIGGEEGMDGKNFEYVDSEMSMKKDGSVQ